MLRSLTMKRVKGEASPTQPKGFLVQAKQCATCIYRPESGFDVKDLENQIADRSMPGYFNGHRICHHATTVSAVCCRGFWNRHKNHFTMGQLAQRLGWVRFVNVDKRPELKGE